MVNSSFEGSLKGFFKASGVGSFSGVREVLRV